MNKIVIVIAKEVVINVVVKAVVQAVLKSHKKLTSFDTSLII